MTAVQFDIAWEDPQANFTAVAKLFQLSPPRENSLVVLPEMFATGFSMNTQVTLGAYDETRKFLADLARRFGVSICGGVVSPGPGDKPVNAALLFDATGQEIASAAKIHLFSKAGENQHHAPGREICVVDMAGVRLAVLICYDLRFPESFRQAVCRGAEVFLVPANWPGVRREHWSALLLARAIENQACLVGVNRIGSSPDCEYSGDSLIVDPRGNVLADASCQAGLITAELDIEALREYRKEFPVLADMRRS